MSNEPRAVFRAVGQLGLLYHGVLGLYSLVVQLTWCVTTGCPRQVPAFLTLGLTVFSVAALVAFWATCRDHRRVVAVSCTALMVAYVLGWSVYALAVSAWPPQVTSLAALLTHHLVSIGPLVLLLLSYRGAKRPRADEPSVAVWLLVLAPLLGLRVELLYLPAITPFPSTALLELLVAGLLYGVMRRWRPAPGMASWAPTTLVLTALALPDATLSRWVFFDYQDDPAPAWWATLFWLAELAVIIALAARQWTIARRSPAGPPARRPSRQAGRHQALKPRPPPSTRSLRARPTRSPSGSPTVQQVSERSCERIREHRARPHQP